MSIRYTNDDHRTPAQIAVDEAARVDVEQSGGTWARMTLQQREQLRARVHGRKEAAIAARAQKPESLEARISRLEERVARLER